MSKAKHKQQAEEVDLGQLFRMIGNGFNRLFNFISTIFNEIFKGFLWLVLFIEKRIKILGTVAFIGLALGFLIEAVSPPAYKSSIAIKQNYATGKPLYDMVDYYNGLLVDKDYKTLGNLLGVNEQVTKEITELSIKPIRTENDLIVLYNKYVQSLDSLAASMVDYDEYAENLMSFTHVNQQISIKSKTRANFKNIFTSILYNMETNPFFVNEQTKDLSELEDAKLVLIKSLSESEALQKTYKGVLEQEFASRTTSEIGITFEGNNDQKKTREFELFKSDIDLRQEIVRIDRAIKDKEHIIDLISNKNDNGFIDNTKKLFGSDVPIKYYYLIVIFPLTFIVLFGIEFLSFVKRMRSQNPKVQ
jgi:hypothetical protein